MTFTSDELQDLASRLDDILDGYVPVAGRFANPFIPNVLFSEVAEVRDLILGKIPPATLDRWFEQEAAIGLFADLVDIDRTSIPVPDNAPSNRRFVITDVGATRLGHERNVRLLDTTSGGVVVASPAAVIQSPQRAWAAGGGPVPVEEVHEP